MYSDWYRLGDQIVSVNGFTLMKVQHADAVQALKDSGSNVVLVCVVHVDNFMLGSLGEKRPHIHLYHFTLIIYICGLVS